MSQSKFDLLFESVVLKKVNQDELGGVAGGAHPTLEQTDTPATCKAASTGICCD